MRFTHVQWRVLTGSSFVCLAAIVYMILISILLHPEETILPAVSVSEPRHFEYSPIAKPAVVLPSAGMDPLTAEIPPAETPIDLNTATFEQLTTLPRIGSKTASSIIDFRKNHGGFKTVDDLLEIRGIGTKTLDRIRNRLTIGPYDASIERQAAAGLEIAEGTIPPDGRVTDTDRDDEAAVKPIDSACGPGKININTATAEELESLPKIGPATAAKIVDDRDKNGKFESVEALDRVKGIGPKTIERLQNMICAE